ncbi:hypothetical protein [Streptomonospora nanhaiensis]|uniref:hypothetical protein n=1 Tax=Streptomonospora nanhaiensis TaxID=1323731 RepID=UPI001C388854|nr:hypothetical protein [Streptomonospora nanhaiensis]MBV2365342.1 hypothetical protein [Streptomonospora nanhaiensis]
MPTGPRPGGDAAAGAEGRGAPARGGARGGGRPARGPRPGRWIADLLVAPGATSGETGVTFAAAALGAAAVLAGALAAGWPPVAVAVAVLVAFDYVGGATANATGAAKRRFHGPHRRWHHHLGFVAAHVQPVAAAWAVPGFAVAEGVVVYLATLGAAAAVLAAPARLRRPAAFAATALGIAAASVLLDVPPAIAWLAPVGLVKLLPGHLLPDGMDGRARTGGADGRESPDGTAGPHGGAPGR